MDKIILTEEDILALREKVRPYLTEKRFIHTLSVEKEADRLGEIYLPDERFRLRAAALLHDITKKDTHEKQLQYCAEFGIIQSSGEKTDEVYHALTASLVARRDFSAYTDDGIISAVRNHTTGKGGMNVFDAIIYLADYIEETRAFVGCRELRSYFWDRTECGDDKYEILKDTLVKSFDMTIKHLIEKGNVIDPDTVDARNTLLSKGIGTEVTIE